jgi:hypothetical protein
MDEGRNLNAVSVRLSQNITNRHLNVIIEGKFMKTKILFFYNQENYQPALATLFWEWRL